MDWSQFWNGFTPNYLDFWRFFRPFIYGGIGGISLFLMSYINISSSLVQTKNRLQFSPNAQHTVTAQKTNSWRSRYFRAKVAFVHFFVGGVSGMIAVNSFNPTANELQTFSIAVIAGLSGFAFLKRSALADDNSAEKILDVEEEPLNSTQENVHGLIEVVSEELGTETPEIEENLNIEEQQILLEDDTSSKLDEFLNKLKDSGLIKTKDIIYYKTLKRDGYTDDEIIQYILHILEDI